MFVVKAGRISVHQVAVGIVVEFNFGVPLDSLFVMWYFVELLWAWGNSILFRLTINVYVLYSTQFQTDKYFTKETFWMSLSNICLNKANKKHKRQNGEIQVEVNTGLTKEAPQYVRLGRDWPGHQTSRSSITFLQCKTKSISGFCNQSQSHYCSTTQNWKETI